MNDCFYCRAKEGELKPVHLFEHQGETICPSCALANYLDDISAEARKVIMDLESKLKTQRTKLAMLMKGISLNCNECLGKLNECPSRDQCFLWAYSPSNPKNKAQHRRFLRRRDDKKTKQS